MQDCSQEPALIDFSLAMKRPSRWNLAGRWVFHQAQELDRIAVERIRARYEVLSDGPPLPAAPSVPAPFGLYVIGRFVKRSLRRARGKA